jgi:geranylgeranyl pyrophosphate synthase
MYRYPLLSGGKRMRPLWVIASNDAVAGTAGEGSLTDGLMHVAAALELIHCYSLVHDDLPCMDDDDERRGRPTVHKVYGEGPAVLVGDALLTEALALALRAPGLKAEQRVAIALELTQAAGYLGMIGGQAADIGLGGKVDNQADLERLHRGKTGALIRAGCRMGGLVAGANESEMNALTRYGESIGLAFQLADDVLDAEEDAGEEGPPSFVKLMGLEACKAEADRLFNEALEALGDFQAKAEPLRQLAAYTVQRNI